MTLFGLFWIVTAEDFAGELPAALAIGSVLALIVMGYAAFARSDRDRS